MHKIFSVVLVSSVLAAGASFADESDFHDGPVARPMVTQPMAPRMAGARHATAMRHGPQWTVNVLEPGQQANRRATGANRDTAPGAIRRELAANPGLTSSLKKIGIAPREIASISIHNGHRATVYLRS